MKPSKNNLVNFFESEIEHWQCFNLHPLAVTCKQPNIAQGRVSHTGTIQVGSKTTVTCNRGYKLSGTAEMTCGDDGKFDNQPTCEGCPLIYRKWYKVEINKHSLLFKFQYSS